MTDRPDDSASTTHVVVTGVSQGLGEALAFELLGRGMRVLGVGRSSSPRLAHQSYRFLRCDLAQATMLPAVLEPAFAAIASERPSYTFVSSTMPRRWIRSACSARQRPITSRRR